MSRSLRCESGALVVEAALSLSIYLFAVLAFLGLIRVVSVEAMTQHAIDQTALQLSGMLTMTEHFHLVDGETEDASDRYFDVMAMLQGGAGADDWSNLLRDVARDGLTQMAIRDILVPSVFSAHLQKSRMQGDAHVYLLRNGVIGGGGGFDFRLSSVFARNREIALDVVYQVEMTGLLRILPPLSIHQSARTSAWKPAAFAKTDRDPFLEKETEEAQENSVWQLSPWERGRQLVSWRKSLGDMAVIASGQGFDLWSASNNTLESIVSLNPFAASYSTYTANGDDPHDVANYQLREDALYRKIRRYADDAGADLDKLKGLLQMEDGTTITIQNSTMDLSVIVPIEAQRDRDLFTRIQQRVCEETGVAVHIYFREKGLLP